ncbi:EmrB/QacA subfamily drug resistance transporter [Humibacillus xanthopallidus]|uniref:EmrB/QacA subfamily drug resistance transporter n=1 Tax=Humibacillus xanthopallidus TaxID=412689 RepID=A0A543PTV0_9MICO|nr:MFS transporter [Humibacillus xanthopallidus]TQN47503.1 EmrB/QacA subfamily drug resistance transporter [Humibacillus xanthopallidus]
MTDDQPTRVRQPEAEAPDPRRWRALTVCLVAGFMTLLDVSIVNVALPSIQQGVGASPSDLQWIVSGYALAFGLTLVGAGRVGDVVGRRPVFIAGVVLFGVASLACGLASSSAVLVAARLVQGAAGGILNPQVSGLIQQMFSGRERGRAFGMLGATIGISTAVGPIVGGLIISALGAEAGWRWIFFVNLPIAVVAVVLARRWLPAPRRASSARLDLDPVGVVLLGATVLALLLPLVETGRGSGASGSGSVAIPWWVALIGGALAVVFVAWERSYTRRGRSPLVDLDLFRVPGYSSGAIVGLIYFGGFTGIFFVLTIYFQEALGYTPLLAGLAVTPFAAGSAVAAAVGGYLVGRFGRLLVTVGLTTVLAGLVVVDLVLAHVTGPRLGWALAVPLLIAGIGSGLVISPNVTLTLAAVPVPRAGTAGGLLQTGQRIGTAAGIALIGAVYFAVSATHDSTRGAVWALRVAAGLVAVALLASGLDLRARRGPVHPTRDDDADDADEADEEAAGEGDDTEVVTGA